MFKSNKTGRFSGGGGRGGKKYGGGGFGKRSFGGRDSGRTEMHSAVCDQCHKDCEVPFKPSGDRPVLCHECFQKAGGGPEKPGRKDFGRRSFDKHDGDVSNKQFEILNEKLDRILKALEEG